MVEDTVLEHDVSIHRGSLSFPYLFFSSHRLISFLISHFSFLSLLLFFIFLFFIILDEATDVVKICQKGRLMASRYNKPEAIELFRSQIKGV